MGAIDGWIRLAPKLMTGLFPAATLKREARVAMPDAWHRQPRIAVSISPKSRYFPSMVMTGV